MSAHSASSAPATDGAALGDRDIVQHLAASAAATSAANANDAAAILRDEVGPSDPGFGGVAKRARDILGALAMLIFFAPLMAVIFVCVRRDGGPGIFAHERVGKNGVTFRCYKFRSMVPNAEQVLKDILVCNEQFRKDWETDQKLRNDPRITRIGAFLRRKSLDELPQLFNVLKGDMSLVGPRPITRDEVQRYGDRIAYYYSIRPGLTGAWQVSGRNEVSYEERVALDVAYLRNRTFVNDIFILLKTVRVVLNGRGAL